MAARPGLLAVRNDIAAEDEIEFNAWYVEEHVPGRLEVPGILSARRYRDAAAPRSYAALYGEGKLKPLITARYPLERFAEAIARFESRQVQGKIVLPL